MLLGVALALAGAPAPAEAQPSTLAGDEVQVVFWPGHAELAARVLEAARTPFPLPGIPPAAVVPAGTIYLAPSPEIFDSLTGGRVPEWGAGVAIPALRMIVLPVYPRPGPPTAGDPAVTLRHELAHLALHSYLPDPIPRWFDEGYATWVSGGWDQAGAWQIRVAFLLGRAPQLDSLTLDWPRGAERARLAYLLSASAVRHLAEIGGEAGFEALLTAWRAEGGFDPALRRVYGMTPGQFETQWRAMVRRRYGWLLALSQVTVFWALVSILLLGLYAVRRRRKKERLAELEEHDRLYPLEPIEEEEEPAEAVQEEPGRVDPNRRES